ncbi:MAG: TetR family transcriptional regulator [Burkholderiaceae bacterium]
MLASAARLFSAHGAASVSLRRIAADAAVAPTLVAYHFGDKEGLLNAVLDVAFERLLAVIERAMQRPEDALIPGFVPAYLAALARDPWIAPLMVREVLSHDGGGRRRFIERFGRRVAELVPPALAEEAAKGRLRADLDPRLTLLSLVGMCAFPFIAEPVLGPVFGYRIDPAFADRLAAHTTDIFINGARSRP